MSAEIVRALRHDADSYLLSRGIAPTMRCVVGVPARFNEAARDATRTACVLGGFAEVELITEPEAAALA